MYNRYIQKGTKRLRLGYTTGTCAAGAAKAAAQTLLTGVPVRCVSIAVPAGDEIPLEIEDLTISGNTVSCAVRKDGGDDPDATHGMLIYAAVSRISEDAGAVRITDSGKTVNANAEHIADSRERAEKRQAVRDDVIQAEDSRITAADSETSDLCDAPHRTEITGSAGITENVPDSGPADTGRIDISGGVGIGRVTKPGLDQPVGAAAINSVPRSMITENVREIMNRCGYAGGLRVVIFAPEGETIAKKTFNPHLGIEGGISIIGTTGIVEPMSNDAILGTVKAELSMRRAAGEKIAFLTIGNYGNSYLTAHYPALTRKAVTCSNFIGDSIDLCLEMHFEEILILGHFGKLVKIGAGIMNTHSSFADGRMEVLIACALYAGAGTETLRQIAAAATTDSAIAILKENGILDETMEQLTARVDYYLRKKVKDEIPIGAILFTQAEKVTVQTPAAGEILRRLSGVG